jgi:triosephosphate isomerase (TIM)
MTRPRIVIGNWKMNPQSVEAAVELARLVAASPKPRGVRVGIAPSSIALPAVADAVRGSDIAVYAQDVHWEEKGAYTGQISAPMVKPFAVGSIVGHSEVRRDLGDDDVRVAKKTVRALKDGLLVVLCVGERENEFDAGATEDVLVAQMTPVLRALSEAHEIDTLSERFVVAYEPVWAIGTGKPATAAHATAATRTIRRVMREEVGLDGDTIPILYGGSVTAATALEFAKADGIDGALVGGASLKAEEFASIVRAFG